MTFNENKKLGQSDKFHVADVDGEKMLLNAQMRSGIHLDLAASLIWQLCDTTRTATEIVKEISDIYAGDPSFVPSDVTDALEKLVDLRALEYIDD